ncbi:MAG: TonB-dependent receptor [Lishizhenia sp.]
MKYIIISLLCLFGKSSFGQISGTIYGSVQDKKSPIFGAQVFFKNSKIGVLTKENGTFTLDKLPKLPDTLIFRASGYYPDTLVIDKGDKNLNLEIVLYSEQLLPEVVIQYKLENSSISKLNPIFVENLNSGELRKAACCNLSESFETNASVDVNITDAVSGAKKIAMMGLDGTYTQIQFENIPILKNLGTSYGLGMIPGTWINSIQITKGTGNVVNGYESMAGLINLEFNKPDHMEKLFVNAYGNIRGRMEANVHSGIKLNKKWSTGIFVHGSQGKLEVDRNNDGFRDIPFTENVSLLNRWNYQGKLFESKFGVRATLTNKIGGQNNFNPRDNSENLYGVQIDNKHIELFAKTGFLFKEKLNSSIGVIYQAKYHELNAQFGDRSMHGIEKRGYVNAVFNGIIGNTDHQIKTGLSIVYDDLQQTHYNLGFDSLTTQLNRTEIVPGAFAEYTYTNTRHSLIVGARGDYHNLFDFQFTPRVHYKFKVTEAMDLRATSGRGFRVPNFVADNASLLANGKPWIFNEVITPEISWNFGGSLVYTLELFKRKAVWSTDFYHTLFTNQMIVDRDADPNLIVFTNLNGRSFSNAFQTDFSFEPKKNLEIKMAYKYLDVRAAFGGILQQKVMVPKHRAFLNIGYSTRNERWEYDATLSVFGKQRLPIANLANGSSTTINTSDIYPLLGGQITHKYKRWDFYLGGENILDYRQNDAIIDAKNPFSTTFDATRIWASVAGINIYAGFRFSIDQKEK